MIKIKSYSDIWEIGGVLYSVGDLNLPFSLTFEQIAWFISSLAVMFGLTNFPPFSMLEPVVSYIIIPVCLTILMCKIKFDGKAPPFFILSLLKYASRDKITYMGVKVKKRKKYRVNENITIVRSEIYNDTN